ncbi:MAG: AI-2E family transporter [Phenylobacterium sp.]|nr:AI-2E family transporter [Phenylobacterium sp.]
MSRVETEVLPSPPPERGRGLERACLVVLAVIAAAAAAKALSGVLAPFAMALFLAVVLASFASSLERGLGGVLRSRRRLGMPLALALTGLLFSGLLVLTIDNASAFASKLMSYGPRLSALVAELAEAAPIAAAPSLDEILPRLDPGGYLVSAAGVVQSMAADTLLILVYLGFILASRRSLERKVLNLSDIREERRAVAAAYRAIITSVEQYLWVQTVTGLIIAAASWAAMAAVGLDGATFLAILIFLACYIPIVGAALGVVAAPVFALLQFESHWQAVFLYVVLQGPHLVVGNVVVPRMQGRSLNMDPLVVLLSLAFWGWLWGVVGMFLSTPLTVIVMVICAQFRRSRWVAILLSEDGQPGEPSRPAPADAA